MGDGKLSMLLRNVYYLIYTHVKFSLQYCLLKKTSGLFGC